MVRLTEAEKVKLPKGNLRAVQKAVNDKLKQVSVSDQHFYDDWAGYTAKEFKYNIRVFKNCAHVLVYAKIKPPVNKLELDKFYHSLKRYRYKGISYKLSFRKAYNNIPAHYYLRFPVDKVSFTRIKKTKKSLTHSQVVKEIDSRPLTFHEIQCRARIAMEKC